MYPVCRALSHLHKRVVDCVNGFGVVGGGDADDDVQLAGTLVDHADVNARPGQGGEIYS